VPPWTAPAVSLSEPFEDGLALLRVAEQRALLRGGRQISAGIAIDIVGEHLPAPHAL